MTALDQDRRADPADNLKPAKDKSTGRIDGLVALAMALGVAASQAAEESIDAFIYEPLSL